MVNLMKNDREISLLCEWSTPSGELQSGRSLRTEHQETLLLLPQTRNSLLPLISQIPPTCRTSPLSSDWWWQSSIEGSRHRSIHWWIWWTPRLRMLGPHTFPSRRRISSALLSHTWRECPWCVQTHAAAHGSTWSCCLVLDGSIWWCSPFSSRATTSSDTCRLSMIQLVLPNHLKWAVSSTLFSSIPPAWSLISLRGLSWTSFPVILQWDDYLVVN